MQFFLLLPPLGHVKKSKRAHTGWAGGRSGPAIPCISSSSLPRSFKRLRARSICRRMKPKKHIVFAQAAKRERSGVAWHRRYLLPHEKTKPDGDKRRTGGGLMRSLNHGSATCEAAFMQTLAPTVLVLGVESHSLRRRSPPPRAGCCVQVVGLPRRHSWETTRVVASWVRFRKAERNPAFLLSSLSWQDRCN